MEMPEGCSKTLQISYIEDASLRPDPEYVWLIETQRDGRTMVTCRKTFEVALVVAKRELGIP